MKLNLLSNHWGFYTKPSLVTCKGNIEKAWFVQFYFATHDSGKRPNQNRPIQIKGGINNFKNKAERTRQGNALQAYVTEKLQNDWHPGENKYPDRNLAPHEQWREKTVVQALGEVFINKNFSSKHTSSNYGVAVDVFTEAMTALDLQATKMKDLRRSTILVVLDAYKEIRAAADNCYNTNLCYLKAMFTVACDYCDFEYSPASKIKPLVVCQGEGHIPPTDDEMIVIGETFEKISIHYLIYLNVIYHTGMRPDEVLGLRISDLVVTRKMFRIVPEKERHNSKTKNIREIPINEYLWQYIELLQLIHFSKDHYIFGCPLIEKKKAKAVGFEHGYFQPGPSKVREVTAGLIWKEVVKIQLGFRCSMYGLKHKGGDDKLMAGVSIGALQDIYGHARERTTKRYVSKLNQVYETELRKLSPAWKTREVPAVDPKLN